MVITFFSEHTERADLVSALLKANQQARRLTRLDSLSRENKEWAEVHEYMNMLLDLLED